METQELTAQDLGFPRGWEIVKEEDYLPGSACGSAGCFLAPAYNGLILVCHSRQLRFVGVVGDGFLAVGDQWGVRRGTTIAGIVFDECIGSTPCRYIPGTTHQFWTWHVTKDFDSTLTGFVSYDRALSPKKVQKLWKEAKNA